MLDFVSFFITWQTSYTKIVHDFNVVNPKKQFPAQIRYIFFVNCIKTVILRQKYVSRISQIVLGRPLFENYANRWRTHSGGLDVYQ